MTSFTRNSLQAPEFMTDDDLVATLNVRHDPLLALKELGRRRSSQVFEPARVFVSEQCIPLELRTTAAIELGKMAAPENQAALIKALDTNEPMLVKNVAIAVGRIGDEAALERLEAIKIIPEDPAYLSVEFAKSLISYRLRLDSHQFILPHLQERLVLDRENAVALPVARLSSDILETVQSDLDRQLPAIAIIKQGAAQFTCRNNQFWIVLTETLQDSVGITSLGEKSAIAAVVLKKTTCSSSQYSVYEYIFTNPPKDNDVEIIGVRASGIVVHGGEIKVGSGENLFRLSAANTIHSPALELRGAFDESEKQLNLEEFLVSRRLVTEQQRPRVPHLSS